MAGIMLIRRTPSHAVVAHCRETSLGIELLRITPDAGEMPFWEDLAGAAFPDKKALRTAILSRMRALSSGQPQITTLDRILLSRSAYDAWMNAVAGADLTGLDPKSIPDEQAAKLPDGRLRIWVELPIKTVEIFVAPTNWRWRDN